MSVALPPALEQRLAALAPRVRALRVVRGACQLTAGALAAVTLVLLLDAALNLPAWSRCVLLSAWLVSVGVMVWRMVIWPWQTDVSLAEIAHEVGRGLPKLGERLRALASGEPDAAPPVLQTVIAEDTARRAQGLDLAQAVSLRPAVWTSAVIVVAVCSAVVGAAVVPGSGERLRRVAMPWHRGEPVAVRVVVTSGEPVVKRGGPVTLAAYAERAEPGVPIPIEATLVLREPPGGPEQRLPMTGDGTGAFHLTRPNAADHFEYRVEIGAATSEWRRVSVIEAAELAPGTTTEVIPPPYAGTAGTPVPGMRAIEGLQHGTATFRFRFTNPPAAALLEWRADGVPSAELLDIVFAPDRLSGTASLALRQNGTLRLVLVTEANGKRLPIETIVLVRVTPDGPPRLEQLAGLTAHPRTARPTETLRVEITARDDVAVAGAVLEYAVGGGEAKSVRIALSRAPDGTFTGRHDFPLAGKGRDGDVVRFRVRITDNRALATPKLHPQETVYPPTGWSEVRISATAPPLVLQDIACQRDAVNEMLLALLKKVESAAAEARKLQTDTAGRDVLAVDEVVRLNRLRDALAAALAALTELASDTALTPELRSLADTLRHVVEAHLVPAGDAIRGAESPALRAAAFDTAVRHLTDTSEKLTALKLRNEQLARVRLDRAALALLATDQAALADALKRGAKDVPDRQRELLDRLLALVADSEALRAAVAAARADEVRQLARTVADLAALVRALDAAATRTTADARAALVATIAREQDTLAKRAEAVLAKLDTAARLANVALPRPDDFRTVADLAAAGKTVEALAVLDAQILAFERLVDVFERWALDRTDPAIAAKQLAAWQDDLLTRFRAATRGVPFDKLPDATRAAFRAEQKALAAAVGALALPPDEAVTGPHRNAALHTAKAAEYLAGDGIGADTAMKFAVESLTRLAAATPTVAKRLVKALPELRQLRAEQDAITIAVEAVFRAPDRIAVDGPAIAGYARQLAPQAARQRKLVEAVAALDLPGLGERHSRLIAALTAAADDLREGLPFDILASQGWVKREFDRLRLVLDGFAPPDVRAGELRDKLLTLADALDALGPMVTEAQLRPAALTVQEVLRQINALPAPESPTLLDETQRAVQTADAVFRNGSKPDEVRKRVRAAAVSVGALADRLDGLETDLWRVQRFAAARRRGVENPRALFASDELMRQLGREADELATTRVGAAGQLAKKRVLDIYARLKAKTDPDRAGTDQKSLVIALDELAAKMADIAELSTLPAPAPVAPPADADVYLPSRLLADELRGLVNGQRALHARVTDLAAEVSGKFVPAAVNPFEPLVGKQLALATDARDLAKQLLDAKDGAGDGAEKAAGESQMAADRLAVGDARGAKEAADRAAERLRVLAAAGAGKPWVARAADLLRRQEAIAAECVPLFDLPTASAAQQVVRAAELARKVADLAETLDRAAALFAPNDAAGKALRDGAHAARQAAKKLTDAGKLAAAGDAAEAAKQRAGAEEWLRIGVDGVGTVAPKADPIAGLALGVRLRLAEKEMRKALAAIESDPAAAEAAMWAATGALRDAGK